MQSPATRDAVSMTFHLDVVKLQGGFVPIMTAAQYIV